MARIRRLGWASSTGLVMLGLICALALLAPFLYPGDPWHMVGAPMLPPLSPGFPLGTDALGRDTAAGIAYGARMSLLIGFVASFCAIVLGTYVGAVAGYFGGWIDDALMRLTEFFQTIPGFMLAIVFVA
ncbi:MAG: ABC transporter permease subunit, partial [Acetobacteraceae bacterium]